MGLLVNFRRNRAIRTYTKYLPGLLAKEYGKSTVYTPARVRRAIENFGLSASYA